jgi:hypothetical protein
MNQIVSIPVSDLLLDGDNPRLTEGHTTQQETALNLARQQGENIVRLANDIVKNGLDPTALPAVVATADARKRYRVVEGNRRVLALLALETPSLIAPVMSPASNRKLIELSVKYQTSPVANVQCVLFDTEEEALHWIDLRHTGQNQGVGLVDWGAEEKDRFASRHSGGSRNPAGQLIEFVEKCGQLSAEALASTQKIQTNVERLLSSPHVREKLGVDVVRGKVISLFPASEISKALTRMIEDLRTGRVTVPDLYKVGQRNDYVDSFPRSVFPKKSTKLVESVLLEDLTAGLKKPRSAPPKRTTGKPRATPRTTIIPRSTNLNVTPPRINAIYNELLNLSAETYTNACSVLMRVFLELSVDHYIEENKLPLPKSGGNTPLAQRLKMVSTNLHSKKKINDKLKVAIEGVANGGQSVFAASIPTFNQYVHNKYVFPKHAELYVAWDEISPLMEKLWPQ